ncbi:hypothetical protein JCM6882_003317 [Rhodosporidiobolus microsporus]
MQSAPRLVRTTLLRSAPRQTQSSPFSFAPDSVATPGPLYSLHANSYASALPYSPSASRFPTSHVRGFASSSISLAKEADQNPFEDPKFSEHAPLFERVAQSPEVLDAIERMAKLTQEKTGVDLAGGDKPSMMMMLKLARDPDLRAAAEHLMASLKRAGVEIDPQQAFQALSMMGGKGFEGTEGLEGLHEKVRKGEDGEGEGEKK